MTIASIATPYWVSYTVKADNSGATYTKSLGLHQSCSSLDDPNCRHFPDDDDCRDDQFFCSIWRSSGFLLSFATIVELATLITFLVILAGGKYKRETGWKLVGSFLIADAAVEFAGMGLVVSLGSFCFHGVYMTDALPHLLGRGPKEGGRRKRKLIDYLTSNRPTCSITTNSSRSPAGASPRPGSSAS